MHRRNLFNWDPNFGEYILSTRYKHNIQTRRIFENLVNVQFLKFKIHNSPESNAHFKMGFIQCFKKDRYIFKQKSKLDECTK